MTPPASVQRCAECFSHDQPLSAFKQLINQQLQATQQAFDPQQSVKPLINQKSAFIDNLLTSCWQQFVPTHSTALSLIAIGGYGRSELFPHSDVDILILTTEALNSQTQEQLGSFSRFLWDIGLKPGECVRTLAECLAAARDDQTIFTSLLDMRLITGDSTLHNTLQQALAAPDMWPSPAFFAAKEAEQRQRHHKFHDTAYNLEPNLKECPGGLRDFHVIAWVLKHHYQSNTLMELIAHGYLEQAEYERLLASRDWIWRLRFALHSSTHRCEDRLLFDYQRELAQQFGFIDSQQQPDVEQLMHTYFTTASEIAQLNEMLLQLLHEKLISSQESLTPQPLTAEFTAIGGYIQAADDAIFARNPLALLSIFLLLQQVPKLKGIRASTIRLIRHNLHRIDDSFRHNPQANQLFMTILRQPRGITRQLKRMSRLGVLPAYLPDFAHIVARMQYDLFHVYTVDQHTLFLIRNLRRFALRRFNNELPFCNTIFLLIPKPEILYLAALFHDIAKGRGGDHSQLGEGIALRFCLQHGLSAGDAKRVAWLVRHHLLMSMTAQRKDISDPDVIHTFALDVGSIEALNYLYLLTVADIRATNPSLWSAWKDSLLKELYIATHSALHRGLENPMAREQRIAENTEEARATLQVHGLSPSAIQQAWQHVDDNYFLRYSADEIVWHTLAISAAPADTLPLVLLRPKTQRGSAEIFIYTHDASGIFSICSATIDQLGLTILDARIMTTADHYVLNSFQVLEQSGEVIKDLQREQHICSSLRQALLRQTPPPPCINIHKQSRQARHFPIQTCITYLDDPKQRHTVIELITTDRAGLLSRVGSVFSAFALQLHDAKITTIGSRAEDVFYITNAAGTPLTDSATLQALQQALLDSVTEYDAP